MSLMTYISTTFGVPPLIEPSKAPVINISCPKDKDVIKIDKKVKM